MSKHKALELAHDLEIWARLYATTDYTDEMANNSAAELRAMHAREQRQHALIVQMREALTQCVSWVHEAAPHFVGAETHDALAAADQYLEEQA